MLEVLISSMSKNFQQLNHVFLKFQYQKIKKYLLRIRKYISSTKKNHPTFLGSHGFGGHVYIKEISVMTQVHQRIRDT